MSDASIYGYCGWRTKEFPDEVRRMDDGALMSWVEMYKKLSDGDRVGTQFRQFRRLCIQEAVRRRLMQDPGGAP